MQEKLCHRRYLTGIWWGERVIFMKQWTIFPFGGTQALPVAVDALAACGATIAKTPTEKVTHLLLPVPSFDSDGTVWGGGDPEEILKLLPQDITVLGGKLTHPALAGYDKRDLLQEEQYLAENAELTAQCTLRLLFNLLPVHLKGLPVLIIGWGRIGKCLGKKLQLLGARVFVAARKETDRAMLRALGYEALSIEQMKATLSRYRVILNTAPQSVLSREELQSCRCDSFKIDLASVSGMEGADVLWARGLPGKYLPESSGKLIADAVLRLCGKEAAL